MAVHASGNAGGTLSSVGDGTNTWSILTQVSTGQNNGQFSALAGFYYATGGTFTVSALFASSNFRLCSVTYATDADTTIEEQARWRPRRRPRCWCRAPALSLSLMNSL